LSRSLGGGDSGRVFSSEEEGSGGDEEETDMEGIFGIFGRGRVFESVDMKR
jgi:hypothetical protein